MALFAKDPNEIINESIQFVASKTGINAITSGSKFRTLLEVMKNNLNAAYTLFDFNSAISTVYGARGEFLDYMGDDIFGLTRKRDNSAFVSASDNVVKFYTNQASFGAINGGQDISIPVGTKIFATREGTRVEFAITSSITLDKTLKEQFVPAMALGSGTRFNIPAGSIVDHEFTDYADYINRSLMVVNIQSIDNGIDAESDDNFRFRIINGKLVRAAANSTAIRLAALSVPGVADVAISDRYYGIGTTGVMVKSTTPQVSQGLLDAVQFAVDQVKSEGTKVIVVSPLYTKVRFVITANFKSTASSIERENTRKNIAVTITDYINNLDVAQALIVNELASLIISENNSLISIGKPGKFFDNIYLDKNLYGNMDVTHEVINDYYPSENEKLIISTVSNAINIR